MTNRFSTLIFLLMALVIIAGCPSSYDGPRWSSEEYSENIEPGKSYYLHQYETQYDFDVEDIVYVAGNLPIVISVPHGGYYEPSDIFYILDIEATFHDRFTQEVAIEIQNAVYTLTGKYVHIIYNKLHRSKFDANRSREEAYTTGGRVESAFDDYHFFIEEAKKHALEFENDDSIRENKCLYIDLHGQSINDYIELGYLINGPTLARDNDYIETVYKDSSLELLYDSLKSENDISFFAELVRGQRSFSAILESQDESQQDFIKCLPNENRNYDYNEYYLDGGYNTIRHSKFLNDHPPENSELIAGFQIELNLDIRETPEARERACTALAKALVEFLRINYKLDI